MILEAPKDNKQIVEDNLQFVNEILKSTISIPNIKIEEKKLEKINNVINQLDEIINEDEGGAKMSKENIAVYVPKTLEKAKELFEKFKQMRLDNLDEEKFFFLFGKGNGEVGFYVRDNVWQVCDPKCELFNITVIEM